MAPGWGRHRARIDGELAPVRDWLVAAVAPRPGQTVLELGAASGDTGLAVAAAVGDGGRLISTDLTPEMVELGRRRAEEVGAGNVEHRVMDGQRIDLPDDSVDAVVARFVVMLMEEPDAALEGARRVLRPGGSSPCRSGGRPSATRGSPSAGRCCASAATCRRWSPASRRPSRWPTPSASPACSMPRGS